MVFSVHIVWFRDPRVGNVCGRLRIHESYCLRRADVAFLGGEAQLAEALWSAANRLEARLRG